MIRQFISSERLIAERCVLEKEEASHLATVLRVASGDTIEGFDGVGHVRPLRVADIGKRHVTLVSAGPLELLPRPVCALTLFVCISKGSRMDWTVEKAVELNVSRIVPVVSARTVVRLKAEEGTQKVERWKRVAREAARQCGANWLPQIDAPVVLDNARSLLEMSAPVLVASLHPGAQPLREALAALPLQARQAGWFVGPEGDFTLEETTQLCAAGALPVSLGRLILRAETAAIYGLSVLGNRWL